MGLVERRVFLLITGIILLSSAAVRLAAQMPSVTYTWSVDTPIGMMVTYWPSQPEEGYDWRDPISVSVMGWDYDKRTATWYDPVMGPQSSEEFVADSIYCDWTCTNGKFVETGTSVASRYMQVTWVADEEPLEPQDTVSITCSADDDAAVPAGELGSRNDGIYAETRELAIRFPKRLTVYHERAQPSSPEYLFAYNNVITVYDNRNRPYAGLIVEQYMVPFPEKNTHPADYPSGPDWIHDMTRTTDADGKAYDLVQWSTENDARNTDDHTYKWAYVKDKASVRQKYWSPRPYPNCNVTLHTGQYGQL
jgi:hypothetical protein